MTTYYEYHPSYLDWVGVSTVSSGYATSEYVPVSVSAGSTQTWTGSGWSTTTDYRGTFYYTTDTYAALGSSFEWSSPVEQPALSIATATAPPAISTAGYILGWDGSDWTVSRNSTIPEGDGVVSLGSFDHPYKDLYVSENTIYLGVHSVSVATGGLEYDSSPIVTSTGGVIEAAGFAATTGIVTAASFHGDGSAIDGISASGLKFGLEYDYGTSTDYVNTPAGFFRVTANDRNFGIHSTDRNSISQAAFFANLRFGWRYTVYVEYDGGACYLTGQYFGDSGGNVYQFRNGTRRGNLPVDGADCKLMIMSSASISVRTVDSEITGVASVSTLAGFGSTAIGIGASLIPDTNVTYDLGSDTNRFRDLYLDGTTIFLGDKEISTQNGKISVDGKTVVAGAGLSVLSGILTASDTVGVLTYFGDASNTTGTGGGGILNSVWKWSTSTSTSDPGDGKVKINNSTYSSATELRISKENEEGYDVGNAFGMVTEGARIYLQERKKGNKYAVFDVTGAPVESSNYWTIPVSLELVGSNLKSGEKCFVAIEVIPKKAEALTGSPNINVSSVELGPSGPTWTNGTGSPEGVVTAPVGSLYSRTDGGAGTTLYVKESGTGNTGWVAK